MIFRYFSAGKFFFAPQKKKFLPHFAHPPTKKISVMAPPLYSVAWRTILRVTDLRLRNVESAMQINEKWQLRHSCILPLHSCMQVNWNINWNKLKQDLKQLKHHVSILFHFSFKCFICFNCFNFTGKCGGK